MMRNSRLAFLVTLATCSLPGLTLQAQQPPTPPATEAPKTEPAKTAPVDPIERIKEEALNKSQVMATLSYLTDVIGPRLTASPNMKRANDWTKDKLASWGLENAHIEKWGTFGKGWELKKFSIQVVEPQCIPLIAFPKAWSPGTSGTVVGEVFDLDSVKTDADLDKLKGKLKGAFVMLGPPIPVEAHFESLGSRLTDKELLELANASEAAGRRPRQRPQVAAATPTPAPTAGPVPDNTPGTPPAANPAPAPATAAAPAQPGPGGPGGRGAQMTPEQRARMVFQQKKMAFAMEEGATAILDGSTLGDGGTLFVAQATVPGQLPALGGAPAARRVSAYDKDAPKLLPQVTVSKEHYNRLLRMLRQGETLKIALDLAVETRENVDTYNTVAEIPGTDLKDEIVMLGGHMDSWHSGTGATDNAAGVSVAMEVVRILKALDLKPRRTIRIALWSGEEQGLLGSAAYVKEHLGQRGDGTRAGMGGGGGGGGGFGGGAPLAKVTPKPEYDKFSAYFNLDNGTGKIRGIYLQGNEAARSVFRPWLTPFKEMGAGTITISNTGGTDHQSFDGINLPGFQFIQDVVEYDTRTHHSNQDLYDRIQADDMKQASAIMAAFVYNTANRDEKIPRKPTPPTAPTSPTPTPPATTATSAAGN
jgi:carboxypeptidase Q